MSIRVVGDEIHSFVDEVRAGEFTQELKRQIPELGTIIDAAKFPHPPGEYSGCEIQLRMTAADKKKLESDSRFGPFMQKVRLKVNDTVTPVSWVS